MDEITLDTKIGFIGTGVMGASMAGHIQSAGYPLHIYTRTRSKAEGVLEFGAKWASSPRELAENCDVIFTIVGFPKDVEDVYFGEEGILPHMRAGTVLVDMTTSSPDLAKRIAAEAGKRGGEALDAPVSGGDKGAREASLSIMVGGDEDTYLKMQGLLGLMGKNIVYQGPAGSGQYCKMCNQIVIASAMVGVCEALAYAQKSGLDPETVLSSISSGAAGSWALSNLAPRILDNDFEPGFYVKHFIKDMAIAAESAKGMGLDVSGLDLALSRYKQLADQGFGDEGTQALFRLYAEG